MRILFLAPALATALPCAAGAEPLTFEAALERAANAAPALKVSEASVRASHARAIAAGQLPDPTLSVGIDNFPISGPPAFRPRDESMTTARIGVEQAFPNPAKRRAEQTARGLRSARRKLDKRSRRKTSAWKRRLPGSIFTMPNVALPSCGALMRVLAIYRLQLRRGLPRVQPGQARPMNPSSCARRLMTGKLSLRLRWPRRKPGSRA